MSFIVKWRRLPFFWYGQWFSVCQDILVLFVVVFRVLFGAYYLTLFGAWVSVDVPVCVCCSFAVFDLVGGFLLVGILSTL